MECYCEVRCWISSAHSHDGVRSKLVPKLKASGTLGSALGEPKTAKDRGLMVVSIMAHPDSEHLGRLTAAVAAGSLEIPIAKRFPLAEAPAAQALAEQGGIGKVLLMPFA